MVETYLATCAVEPGTVLTYRSNLQPAVERWGGRALDAITYTDVVTWVADMNRLRGATRRAPSTMLARLKQVRSVFAEARRLGHVTIDPTVGVRPPKAPETPFPLIDPTAEDALSATSADANDVVSLPEGGGAMSEGKRAMSSCRGCAPAGSTSCRSIRMPTRSREPPATAR